MENRISSRTFSLSAVLLSINNGLITLKELTVSGDGTAVKAHANPFGRNPELSLEVPLLLNFTSAKRHDSINFLFAIDAFGRQGTGLSPKNLGLYKEQLRPPASSPYSTGQ